MTIDEKLAALFRTSPYAVSQIGMRFYRMRAPQSPTLPYAVYQREGRIPLDNMDEVEDPNPARRWRYQISVFDELSDRGGAAAKAIATFLKGYADPGTSGIHRILVTNELEVPSEKQHLTMQVIDIDIMESLPE